MEKNKLTQKDGVMIYVLGFLLLLVAGLLITLIPSNTNLYVYLAFLVPQGAYLAAIFSYTKHKKLEFKLNLAVNAKQNGIKYAYGVILGAGIFFCGLILNYFLKKTYVVLGFDLEITVPVLHSWIDYILSFLLIAVLPAIGEELLFRRTLIDSFSKIGSIKAVIISAAIFSLSHLNPTQTIYQFILGLIYGFVYLKTKDIVITIIAHLVNNCLAFFLSYLTNPLIWQQPKILLFCFLIALPITIFCLYLILKGGKVNNKAEEKINSYTISIIVAMSVLWLIYAFL